MAKKQAFGDKVRKQKEEARKMAKVVVAQKKANGQYSYRQKMVPLEALDAELAAARS